MVKNLDDPMAIVEISWLSAEEGGRCNGPPQVSGGPDCGVYIPARRLPFEEDEAAVDAGEGDYVSILLQKVSGESLSWVAKADFLEPDRVRPHLRIGRFMAVVEGTRLVARARILEVFPEGGVFVGSRWPVDPATADQKDLEKRYSVVSIDEPAALGVVEWISAQAGGRRSGPPWWPYASAGELLQEDMRHHPGCREALGVPLTVGLEPVERVSDTVWRVKMDFLARGSVLPCLWEGRQLVIREWRRVVAVAVITEVLVDGAEREDAS